MKLIKKTQGIEIDDFNIYIPEDALKSECKLKIEEFGEMELDPNCFKNLEEVMNKLDQKITSRLTNIVFLIEETPESEKIDEELEKIEKLKTIKKYLSE